MSALKVAESIGPRLAQAALGVKIDGELRDLSTVIDHDVSLAIVTERDRQKNLDRDALFLIRHSAAHVMAEAIQDVVGKDVQLAYGPPTDTGFFYDMYVPEGKVLSSDMFDAINKRMADIIKEDRKFCRYEVKKDDGLKKLWGEENKYKIDNAERALGMSSSVYRGHKAAPADPARASGGRRALLLRHRRAGEELGGPLPRAARAEHRTDRCGAGDVAGVELLARRRELRPPRARLRHRVPLSERTRRLPQPARASQGARPSRDRQAAQALPYR